MTFSPRALHGYRLVLLKDYDATGRDYTGHYASSELRERRLWSQLKRVRLDTVRAHTRLYYDTTYEEFERCMNSYARQARSDEKALVVVVLESDGHLGSLLKRFEREDWESAGESGVRFAKLDSLVEAAASGSLPKDTWGDEIERGDCAHIFGKDLFAFADVKGPQLHSVYGFSPANSKWLAISELNLGLLLTDEVLADEEEIATVEHCYVVCDGLRDEATEFIDADSLLAELPSIEIVPVNSVWVHICNKRGIKTNPAAYPSLFQPLPFALQRQPLLEEQPRMFVGVSGFVGHCTQAICLWLKILGAACYEYEYAMGVSSITTHFISPSVDSAGYESARAMRIPTVGLGWLEHIMQHGYAPELDWQFQLRITIGVLDLNGTETLMEVEMASPLSETFEEAGIVMSECDLLVHGEAIEDDDATPLSLNLRNMDTIEAWPKTLQIILRDAAKNETTFSVKATDPMSTIFDAYASTKEISPRQCTFLLEDGRRIYDHNETPWALGLKSGSTIDVVHTPTDCNWRVLPGEREPFALDAGSQFDLNGETIDGNRDVTARLLDTDDGDQINVLANRDS